MKLSMYAPINYSGFGSCSRSIFHELNYRGIEISLFPIGGEKNEPWEAEYIKKAIKNAEFYDPDAPCLSIYHPNKSGLRVGRGQYLFFTFHELDCLSEKEKHNLSVPDKVIVASSWGKDVMESCGIKNVEVVPLGVDRSVFNEFVEPTYRKKDVTVFGNISKWEIRKGHSYLLEAFNKAFEKEDNVELWMCPYHVLTDKNKTEELNKSWITQYKTSKLGDKITIFDKFPTSIDLAGFMASIDVGCFPALGEGFGLDSLEMLSIGKPIIITNVTAHKDYVNRDNAYLIDLSEKENAYDGIYFYSELANHPGKWYTFTKKDVDQLVDHMRWIHKKKQEGQLGMNVAGIETAKQFTWANSVDKLSKVIWWDQ